MNWFAVMWTCVVFAWVCRAQGNANGRPQGQGQFRMQTPAFQTEVPKVPADVILGRPTRDSVTLSLLSYADRAGTVEYGPWATGDPAFPGLLDVHLKSGEPVEMKVAGLKAATLYRYRVRLKGKGPDSEDWEHSGSFHTARGPKEGFVFTVQADPHLDYGTVLELYRASLSNVVAAGPDFHVDLGDTFMTDKYAHHEEAAPQYLAQRYWFSQVADRVPLFLVLGNHDGEGPGRGREPDGGAMGIWSNRMRRRYFPNPGGDEFYSVPEGRHPVLGALQSQYAWNWGDGLFVVLDPFWNSVKGRGREQDNWGRTLGRAQYDWLRVLLETNRATHTFVFIHHLVGGDGRDARGGVEASRFFEWGGLGAAGDEEFGKRRPGWEAPIHELLRRRRGVLVFHGHDHFYARQERDGVVYQLVPQPGHRRGGAQSASSYGYKQGEIVGGSGVLAVRMDDSGARVQFLRVDGAGGVAHEYRLGR